MKDKPTPLNLPVIKDPVPVKIISEPDIKQPIKSQDEHQ